MIEERSGDISGQVLVDIQELKSVSMDYLLIVGDKESRKTSGCHICTT